MKAMHRKTHFALVISILALMNVGCEKKEETLTQSSYLDQWVGTYEGNSYQWLSYYSAGQSSQSGVFKKVSIEVSRGSQDSTLDFAYTYNDSILKTEAALHFSDSGFHSSSWGGGSSYATLEIYLHGDSIHYDLHQSCGMTCEQGEYINIQKIK